jgi:hypothetical protein
MRKVRSTLINVSGLSTDESQSKRFVREVPPQIRFRICYCRGNTSLVKRHVINFKRVFQVRIRHMYSFFVTAGFKKIGK